MSKRGSKKADEQPTWSTTPRHWNGKGLRSRAVQLGAVVGVIAALVLAAFFSGGWTWR